MVLIKDKYGDQRNRTERPVRNPGIYGPCNYSELIFHKVVEIIKGYKISPSIKDAGTTGIPYAKE